jgi:hypothetical protein
MPWTKAYTKKYLKEWVKTHRCQFLKCQRDYSRTYKGRFSNLKSLAKKRGLEVTLTLAEYIHLISSGVCYYCGGKITETGYGLDRINSNKGYEKGNLRPCCSFCNRIKSDLSEKEFFKRIERLHNERARRVAKNQRRKG